MLLFFSELELEYRLTKEGVIKSQMVLESKKTKAIKLGK